MYSTYVKNCMADALLELAQNKPYEAITVTELCDKAQVSRVSFYRHFSSKDDILLYRFTNRYETWMDAHPEYSLEKHDALVQAQGFFEFLLSESQLVNALLNLHKLGVIQEFLQNLIGPLGDETPSEAFYRSFYVHGCFGVYREWIRRGMVQSPREMAEFLSSSPSDTRPIPTRQVGDRPVPA